MSFSLSTVCEEVHFFVFGMRSPKVGYIIIVQGRAFSRKSSLIFSVASNQLFIGRPGMLETRVFEL